MFQPGEESAPFVGQADLAIAPVAFNTQLYKTPKLLNTYVDVEWLVKISVKDAQEMSDLQSKKDYENFVKDLSQA